MAASRRFVLRLMNALGFGRAEAEMTREIESHLALLEEEFCRRGMPPEKARLAARRAFGGVEQAKDAHRDARSFVWIDDVRRDLRYGVRALFRNPLFSAVAVLTVALGIGAATTIYSFVHGVLWTPLAYPAGDRLVAVTSTLQGDELSVSPAGFIAWQAQTHSFQRMAAGTITPYTLTGGGEPLGVLAGLVTEGVTDTLQIAAEAGHTFEVENASNRAHTAMLSDRLWRGRFGADPAIVGRSITVEGAPYTVIGVMPPGMSFPLELMSSRGARALPDVDVWLPIELRPDDNSNGFLKVIGRLKPGVTVAQAQAELTALTNAQRLIPDPAAGVLVEPLREQVVRPVRPLLLTLFSAVALLLIVACANVSNLLLSRAAFRQREFAVRGALGSGTRRIIQQCLTESIVLGGIGGAGGLLLANAGVKLVSSLIPQGMLPRLDAVRIDPHVLVFAAAASLFSSVVFGLAPALQAVRTEFASALAGGTRTHTARSSHQQWLIGAEVALAFVLLAGAGLLFKSFERLTSVDPGFRPERVVAADVTLPEGPYPTLAEMRAFASAVLTRIHEQPDVIDAGAVNLLPIGGPMLSGDFLLDGVERPRGFIAVKPAVAPGYFRTIGVPLLQGRDFDDRDTYRTSGVAIVSEQFARRAWPGARPIGRRLKLGFGTPEQQPWLTVVGVVGDIKQRTLADATQPAIYVPLLQAPRPFLLRNLSFVARTRVDTARAASLIRRTIHAVDPDLPVGRIATMDQLIADSVSEPRFRTILLGGFAVSALVLIVIGLVGVLGYSVARRTREIGVRAALGARRTEIALLVVKQSMTITLFGVVAGAMLAYPLTRLLEAFLFDVSPHDLPTFVAIAVILSVTALAASYVPARRATRVDPLAALRCE